MAEKPIKIKDIPPQAVNEGAAYGPLLLKDYIQSPDMDSGEVYFSAALAGDLPLPQGLVCTPDGILSGIPVKGTKGIYELVVTAANEAVDTLETTLTLTVRNANDIMQNSQYYNNLKSQVWAALGKNLPLPEVENLLDRPLTPAEIYYLLQRFATLTIWDVYNLDPPGEKKRLNLKDASPHYEIYDRGSCIVGHPKDLFNYERTLFDAFVTANAMAGYVYDLGWTVEFSGFDMMCRRCWVAFQLLADKYGKPIEILHFQPSLNDFKLYEMEAKALSMQPTARGS